ncbi:hypothetical protein [Pseudobacteriovorax antillogorgiicola]|uniref:HupE / UreJ protein n=1 Tax=Pseudobacteriovorax antillogorgiicola TaxID=1513793 RepID=A0A1Y6BKI8_9BACT|nr:hypothetical protein [Pseudobacteriovorax antillogorgiicola]TCS55412.1 hypothetical protein EDD56_105133 [Pseudobacteriovorax antillogorgiicola]SMF12692.1 hypothetical protein SAMN06296036_105191 [Pseudobacteriovorax antillogorgiicola]
MRAMLRVAIALTLFCILANSAIGQNLDKRSTLIIEQQYYKFRVTLLMARSHYQSPTSEKLARDTDQQALSTIFLNTLEKNQIYLGGRPCEWGNPSGHLTANAIYLQAIAFCMDQTPSSQISWKIGFLKNLPEDHPVIVNLLVGEQIQQMVLNSRDILLRFHPVPVNEAFVKGISFIGVNPKAWFDSYGDIALPLGFWLLFFSLFLGIAEPNMIRARKVIFYYISFLSLSLATSFLWEWSLPQAWATGVILVSMAQYYATHWLIPIFSMRILLVSCVGTIHGIAGLSLLPSISEYFGTISLFAAFQIGAIAGLWLGLVMLIPCVRWINHALPYRETIHRILKIIVFLVSALALIL